jgi:uncharacterized protein YpmB
MRKPTKAESYVIGLSVVVAIVIAIAMSKFANNPVANKAVDYTQLRAELAEVEKGDFVEYNGKWQVVSATHSFGEGN